jgi:3-phenylpropionate/trans-cinnamate dioxygenase ferredoxin reductase component
VEAAVGVPEHVVVVGAGLAGVRTAERLRQAGFEGRVTVVGEEAEPPYDRPPLSKQVLRGERDVVRLRDPDGYDELGVDLRLGVAAGSLDPAARTVSLADGTALGYDALVIATGARPRMLSTGAVAGVHVLRTAEDCRRLRTAALASRRAVVVGGGFIGCEVAASLRTLGLDVTIVELASAPLVGVVGDELAAEVVRLHQSGGVVLRCGVGVAAIEGGDRVTGVRLQDGSLVAADLVVVGLGVVPALAWLDGSGLATDNGVSCDYRGRTSVAEVYAVGDVASWRDPRTGRSHRFEHWTSAADQAAIVARTVVQSDGADTDELPVPYFWSDQYHVKIQSLGLPSATADQIVVLEPSETKRLALYGDDGMLTAVVGIAATAMVMKMRSALSEPTSFADALGRARAMLAS